MSIEDMVVAALVGFDRGEFMMRALPGRGREAFEVARQGATFSPAHAKPGERNEPGKSAAARVPAF